MTSIVHSHWQTWSHEAKNEGDSWQSRQGIFTHLFLLVWILGALNHNLSIDLSPPNPGTQLGIGVELIPDSLPGLIRVVFRWSDGQRLLMETISMVA